MQQHDFPQKLFGTILGNVFIGLLSLAFYALIAVLVIFR